MTPATRQLEHAGVDYEVLAYEHEPQTESFAGEAAELLNLDLAEVYKTLLATNEAGRMVVALVPADRRLDLKALARVVGTKRLTMADPATAERSTGYVVGGISPFGQRRKLDTFVDASALALNTMYVSGGRRGLEIAITPADLIQLLTATAAEIRSVV